MGQDQIYPYEVELFSRNFLNCAQRHSIVMLRAAGVPVEWLFDTAFMPTDRIFDHSIRQRLPKYDFAFDGLTDACFSRVGVTRQSHFMDSFAKARGVILDHIAQDGFVLLAGDVFYFPHCPEYRNKHLFHLVILTGWDENTREWIIVDDNPASVLCNYRWSEDYVAAFYDNSPVREFRTFQTNPQALPMLQAQTLAAFARRLTTRTESFALLHALPALLQSKWFAPESLFPALGEACSILSGSRRCFAAFLRQTPYASLAPKADGSADLAQKLRNRLMRARLTGALPLPAIEGIAADIMQVETALYSDLLAAVATVDCRVLV
jgi:hypothetical protein